MGRTSPPEPAPEEVDLDAESTAVIESVGDLTEFGWDESRLGELERGQGVSLAQATPADQVLRLHSRH